MNASLAGFLTGWLLLAAAIPTLVAAADLTTEFHGVRSRLIAEVRSTHADVRAEALRKFQQYPVPDAAQTLLTQLELTKFADVRSGALEVLRTYGNSVAVGNALLADLRHDLKANRYSLAAEVRLLVLLSGDDPEVRPLARQSLASLEQARGGIPLLIEIVDQLAEFGDAPAARALLRLEEEPILGTHAGLKRAVVQALCRMENKDAVTRLIDRLVTAEGETRADIETRLFQVSGLDPQMPPDWSTWWRDHQEKFEFPIAAAGKPDPLLRAALGKKPGVEVPSYYGLPLYGARILFVIDCSGSMNGPKLVAAKRELLSAINLLPDAARFNIIAFNATVAPWHEELVPVSAESKKEANAWVAARQATAKTHSHTALLAALEQDCDAIYFLTDGAPTGGRYTNPPQIIASISQLNRIRRATINTLGISPGREGQAFDLFLHDLAEQNWGVYKRLD